MLKKLLFVALVCYNCGLTQSVFAQAIKLTSGQLKAAEEQNLQAAYAWADRNAFLHSWTQEKGAIIGITSLLYDHPVFYTTHNRRAGILTGAAQLHPGGNLDLTLSGRGLFIGLWDAGPALQDHQELAGRVQRQDFGDPSDHATHVAGTLIASGVVQEALGMAPDASIHSYNWTFHGSEIEAEALNGMLISNHSYGRITGWHYLTVGPDSSRWHWFGDPSISQTEDYAFGYYDRDAAMFDQLAYAHPNYLPVISAGNERDDKGPPGGYYRAIDLNGRWQTYDIGLRPIPPDGGSGGFDTISSFALAKNVLTVGSVSANVQALGSKPAFNVSPFSSTGPTDDGRIKPDIMAFGERLFSSVAGDTDAYDYYSGTSMATPNVAGSLLLLQQMAFDLWQRPMRAATLKGLAIHTAHDLGEPGPDYQNGWGLLDAEAAARHLQSAFRSPVLIIESQLEDQSKYTLDLLVTETGSVRITLSWTDPPSVSIKPESMAILNNTTPTLINDLDVRLYSYETNQRYLPYILDPRYPSAPASAGDNQLDPAEQIDAGEVPPGVYRLEISHKKTLNQAIPQPFSALLTGFRALSETIALDTLTVDARLGQVNIDWTTKLERIEGDFLLERADATGTTTSGPLTLQYTPVATRSSRGLNASGQSYSFTDAVFLQGTYRYRLLFSDTASRTRTLIAEFDADIPAPEDFVISSIYPNPVADQSRIVLDLPASKPVSVAFYDVLGREMASFTYNILDAGRHFIPIDATSWSPGIYFVRIKAGARQLTRQIVVLKP